MMRKRRKSQSRPKRPAKSSSNGRQYDFLYLLERVSGKTIRSRFLMELEVKFGVTNKCVKERKNEINMDMPGDIKLLTWIYIPEKAAIYEQKLLRKWARKLNPKHTGPSAGRTEWRRVNWLEYIFILIDYWKIRNRKIIGIIKLIILLTTIILYYVYTNQSNIIN